MPKDAGFSQYGAVDGLFSRRVVTFSGLEFWSGLQIYGVKRGYSAELVKTYPLEQINGYKPPFGPVRCLSHSKQ